MIRSKQMVFILLTLSFLFFGLSLSGCNNGLGGTEVGNPTDGEEASFTCDFCFASGQVPSGSPLDGEADPASGSPALSEVGTILYGLCDALELCYDDVTDLACLEALNDSATVLQSVGANTTLYSSFEDLQTAVNADQVSVSDTVLSACESAIEAVTCEQMSEHSAFNPITNSYSRVFLIVPDECGAVF